MFGQQQQQGGGGGFGRGNAARGSNRGQQGGFGQQAAGAGAQGGGMVFGKKAQGGPSPGGRGAAGAAGGRAGGRQGRGSGAAGGGGGWQDTGGGRGRGRFSGGRGQQQYNQQQQQYNQAPQQQQQQRQPRPAYGQQQQQPAPQQPPAKSSPSIMSRLGSVFGFSSGAGKQQPQQQPPAQQQQMQQGYDATAQGGRGRGRGRGARGRGGYSDQQWQQVGGRQQQGDWDAQQSQQGRGQGRGQAGRGRGGRAGWQQQQQQWGQGAAAVQQQQGDGSSDGRGRGRGRDRGRDRGRGGNQVWSRLGSPQQQQQQQSRYLGGEEAEMDDAAAAAGAEEGWEDAGADDAAAGEGGWGHEAGDHGGDYEGNDMDMQDYDMDEAYEGGGGWGEEEEEEEEQQEQQEQEEDDGSGAAAAAAGGFFGQQQQEQQQQQLKQEAQAVFGAPAAAAAAPASQRQRVPVPSPSGAGAAVARPPRPAVPPPPRAAVRAAIAAAVAAEAWPARDVCYAVPAAHAPGSTVASYDAMTPASVVLTAAAPRAALKTRARGAKQPACTDMCPADERDQRTAERQLHPYEREGEAYVTTPQLAVKKYQRSHAGEETDNSALRTWPALAKTLAHLRSILGRLGSPDWGSDRQAVFDLLEAHRFLWDRYRALRKDITQTELPLLGPSQLYWVMCANEEMARFMILADALLADKDKVNKDAREAAASASGKEKAAASPAPRIRFDLEGFREAQLAADAEADAAGGNFEPDPYDGHLNHQELTKTLLDLSALYREAARIGLPAPHACEFMSYYLILSRGTYGRYKASPGNVVRLLTAMSRDVLVSPHVRFALAVSSALMASNWVRLLELMEGAPLLLAATVQVYLPGMRSKALVHLLRNEAVTAVGGGGRVKRLSLEYYTRLLRFDDTTQAREFIQLHQATCPGLTITTTSSGEEVIQLPAAERGQLQVLRTIPRHTLHWLADKAAGSSLDQLVISPCPPPDVEALLGVAPGPEPTAAAAPTAGARFDLLAAASGMPNAGGAGGSRGSATFAGFAAAQQAAAAQQRTKKQQQQDTQHQQQQQPGGVFQFGAAAPAAPPAAATAATPGLTAWSQQQQQQQPGHCAFGSTPGGRGSSDVLPSVLAPAAAVAGATAVFGGLAPPAGQMGLQQQQPVAAVGFGAATAVAVPADQQQWRQQQQQAAWSLQQQPQQAPPAPWQQPQQQQQQQQFVSQAQPQQQQQPAAAAAAAAATAAAAEAAAAASALRAENAALKQKLAEMQAERHDTQQAESMSQELASMRRQRVMRRWCAAASSAKAARERLAAQLAASNATLGRRGEGLMLLGVRRRTQAAAGGPAQRDMQALATGQDDLDLLAPQGKRQRPLAHADAAAAFEAALEDTSPLAVADVMAAALTAATAAGTSDGSSSSSVIYLPSMGSSGLSSSSSSGSAAADGGFGFSSSSSGGAGNAAVRGVPCRAAPLTLRLVCVSGWGEADPRFAPPLVQRRVAQWLRHKVADPRSAAAVFADGSAATAAAGAAANGHGWGQAPQQQQQLVPLDGPATASNGQQQQQQQQRTWAGIVKGTPASSQQQQQQMVLRLCEGVELLSSRAARGPVGPGQCGVVVEVMDVAPTGLDRACAAGSSSSSSSVLAGACGVLLLVPGPDGRELQGAVKRLGLLLEHWPAAAAAPITVLACSGPSTHSDIQVQLGLHMSQLPTELQGRISSAQVVCLGPGGQPPAAALQQALAQAAEAAAPLLPQLHQVQACTLLQALTVLELRAKLAAVEALAAASGNNGTSSVPDLLSAFVEAHNTGLLSLGNCMQAQLDSTAAAWGYPPPSNSSSGSTVWAAASRVMQGAPALALPPPQPLHDFLQHQQQQGTGAAALTQLTAYLDALSSSSREGPEGVSEAVRSVATGMRAVLTATLLQQKQLLLPSPNGSSRSSGRQLSLVRSHCELLLERLQQQPPLQAWLVVDASDLGLIVAADQKQQQPGWWQQQVGGVVGQQQQQALGYEAGVGLLDDDEGPQPWDSPRQQVPLGWHAQGQAGAGGEEEEEEVFDQSPEVAHTVAKQQAAVAAELLAKCRLKPWLA